MRALTAEIGPCKTPSGFQPPASLNNQMLTEKTLATATSMDKPPVLVVDDEYGPRESIAFSLAAEFAVDTAERAKEALVKIQARSYSAVVLDIRMPEMDGIRALEEL